jgi:RimJ/RimL family protein N-acetyltransferase
MLRLRPLHPDDLDALFAISSDPLLWEQHPSKERAEPDGFRRWFDEAMASGGALVAEDPDGTVVGTSRFEHLDLEASEVEIGWTFVAREHWGGSVNREMKRLMLDHAFASVQTVVFRVHSHNLRSQRAVEKLGAVRVGTQTDPMGRGENVVFHLTADQRAPGVR